MHRFEWWAPNSRITYLERNGRTEADHVFTYLYVKGLGVCLCGSHIRQPFLVFRNYDDVLFSIRVVHKIVSDPV